MHFNRRFGNQQKKTAKCTLKVAAQLSSHTLTEEVDDKKEEHTVCSICRSLQQRRELLMMLQTDTQTDITVATASQPGRHVAYETKLQYLLQCGIISECIEKTLTLTEQRYF